MLLFPAKTKYKKSQKRCINLIKKENNYNYPTIGFSGLKSLVSCRLTASQIESVRKIISKNLKKKNKVKLKFVIFPDLPVTKKSAGIRMGKGKGNIEYWCFLLKRGRIVFELNRNQIPIQKIFSCFLNSLYKLPGKWSIII
jgi:large subunit ribosomal protein L16